MTRIEVLGTGIVDVPEKNESDFRLEYGENVPDQVLVDDIVSYLGEYRFKLPKYSYMLKFSDGKLRDPRMGDPMQDLTQRSIDKKILEGYGSSREKAEKQGIMNLDRQLMSAKNNDTVVWASPPGPKEEGYGNYGFIFIGNVSVNHLSEKAVRMTAIRLEDPKIGQFNKAMQLFTGEKADHKQAEEFLADPKVISGCLQEGYVDALLEKSFSFKPNEKEQDKFKRIIQDMFRLLADFVQFAKNLRMSKAEKIIRLYELENYFLRLKREYDQPLTGRESIIVNFKSALELQGIVGEYGVCEPPKAAGSCPANNKNSFISSNLLSKGSFLNDLLGDQEWFVCPKCGYKADGPVGNMCPRDKGGCGLTKEEYARKTGISCD